MGVKNSGLIAMHEPYKTNDISCKNTFGVKKVQPSKIPGSECINRLVTTRSVQYAKSLGHILLLDLVVANLFMHSPPDIIPLCLAAPFLH